MIASADLPFFALADVFRHELLSPELPIGIAHMEISIPDDDDGRPHKRLKPGVPSAKTITYLYKLGPGLATGSNAGACALLHGMPAEVVDEAALVTDYLSRYELDMFLVDQPQDAVQQVDFERGERTARRLLLFERDENPIGGDPKSEEAVREALRVVGAVLDGEVGEWVE